MVRHGGSAADKHRGHLLSSVVDVLVGSGSVEAMPRLFASDVTAQSCFFSRSRYAVRGKHVLFIIALPRPVLVFTYAIVSVLLVIFHPHSLDILYFPYFSTCCRRSPFRADTMGYQQLWGHYSHSHNKCSMLNKSIMSTKSMMRQKPVLKLSLTTELHQVWQPLTTLASPLASPLPAPLPDAPACRSRTSSSSSALARGSDQCGLQDCFDLKIQRRPLPSAG